MAISTYPNRIVTLYTEDYGSFEDGGGTCCPHCGAEGRYIHYFLCDDGIIHAAMSGCIKLYPHNPTTMSKMAELALKQQQDYKNKHIDKKLTSWFATTIDTLDKLKSQDITIEQANAIIVEQYNKRDNWLRQNGYKKQWR